MCPDEDDGVHLKVLHEQEADTYYQSGWSC